MINIYDKFLRILLNLCYNMNMKRIWERLVPISKAGRSFDIEFWQAQPPAARFRAAWQMLADLYRIRGKRLNAHTFRLQRSAETLKQA